LVEVVLVEELEVHLAVAMAAVVLEVDLKVAVVKVVAAMEAVKMAER